MLTVLVIAAAYLATIVTLPLLLLGAELVWQFPSLPTGVAIASPFDLLVGLLFIACATSLPGFALTRFVLWKMRGRSIYNFGMAGALTGILSVLIACMPHYLEALSRYNLLTSSAAIGAAAGLIYRQIELVLFRLGRPMSKPLNLGASGK